MASCVVVTCIRREELATADFLFARNNFIGLYQIASQSSLLKCCQAGADPAIGGPGGRLPLWAELSEKTNEIWSLGSQENH